MKNPLNGGNGMVPHYSGTTLDAQARYAKGTKEILDNYLKGKEQDPGNVIIGIGEWDSSFINRHIVLIIILRCRQMVYQGL